MKISSTGKTLLAILMTYILFVVITVALAYAKADYTFKIGSLVTPSSVWGKTVAVTMRDVQLKTNGRVEIVHLHSGMLGGENNMLEQTLLGGIQGAGISSSSLSTIVPEVQIIELPFLFRDRDEAYYLIDNVISPVLMEIFEKKGLVTSAIMENGFMDFVMGYPVRTPADLKRCKIGSWESPIHIAFWKAEGGNPIPIPATEVFSAHARGLTDSGANTMSAIASWDKLFGTSLKRNKIYITPIHFSYQAGVIIINKKAWEALPPDLRDIFKASFKRLTWQIRNNLRNAESTDIETLKHMGYNFVPITEAERIQFEKNAQKVYKEFEPIVGKAFLNKVLAERSRYRRENTSTKSLKQKDKP